MVHLVSLVKAKSGLSRVDFINRYREHKQLVFALFPLIKTYRVKFLRPLAEADSREGPTFDAVAEFRYDNWADLQTCLAKLADPEISKLIGQNEDRFLDRAGTIVYLCDAIDAAGEATHAAIL